jgi:hypothetical protein
LAYDKVLAIVGYNGPGDLKFPSFSASYAYPIGNLISLFPTSLLDEPLFRILREDNDYKVLQYAAWCAGILNYPVRSEYWRYFQELRLTLPRRATKISKRWLPIVDRQFLFTEAQLGGDEAQSNFLRNLSRSEVGEFEAAYNLAYYEGKRDLIQYRFERRLDEGSMTDNHMRPILSGIYNHMYTRLSAEPKGTLTLRPELWPMK